MRAQQPPKPPVDLNGFLQGLFPVQAEGIDYQSVFDNLAQLYATPLDLNTATRDELAATYLLDERQLNSLLTYRDQYGDLLSVYELQAVPGFDVPTIRRLMPFVEIGTSALSGRLPTPVDHYLLLRYEQTVEEQKGFSAALPDKNGKYPTRYGGGSAQWFARYRYSRPRAYSLGLTVEKDPGEAFRWQPGNRQWGADYVSFHAQVQNRGRWRNLILGDYQLQIGQGLVLSAGFVLGKSSETVQTVRRPTLGARPYTSLTEYGYFRGATATYALTRNMDITLMAARNRRDANTAPSTATTVVEGTIATSLQTSGLHRTPSELADRGSLLETNVGAHLLYHRGQRLQLGATLLHTQFDLPLLRRNLTYNRYEFTGRQNTVLGLHGGYIWHNLNFFGEVAHSHGSLTNSGGVGAVGGMLASFNRRVDVSVVARHYDRNFHSFYANGFSENTRTINETGLYAGLKYTVYRKLTVGGYVDVVRFPWWRYLVDKPSRGFDFLTQATYTPNRQTSFALIFHEEHKEKNKPGSKTTPREVVGTTRRSLALTAEYPLGPRLTLRSRVQAGTFAYTSLSPSRGFALVQDASYAFKRWHLSGRMALFGTDDYDSRQYVYERDVLYAFSFPAYFNRGVRHYVLVQYDVSRHLDLWLRWARTDLTNQDTVGSDLDQINAPHKSELKVQARWRF
ncbi:helix-hairpin-helix domain-containing protein [Rudanella paleaurantiibacter]|uniref:Helix-hairpin-helix domain-containing protein n=1 Tax=Rudanella paleaurantiibacter TaxID=2614655 RepID=A0A7J5U1R0_9BACT|nr:helix-hairpin-helix domain-containing protein [Rudanella paleaurantiibacter]KAB7730530.1 helix-hairpin-helix domain-containing protein [Rudanella paleaurantiibacter]